MLNISVALKNLMLDPVPDVFAGGAIYIYSGTQPANPSMAPSGTLLAVVTLDGGAYSLGDPTNGLHIVATSGGYLTPDPAEAERWIMTGVQTGTAGWARIVTNDDTLLASATLPRIDCAVSTTGGTGLLLETASIINGETKPVDYWIYGIPPFA